MSLLNVLTYITWDIDPDIFIIPLINHPVRWYGLFFALAFLISQQIMYFIYKKERRPVSEIDTLTIYMVVATIVGVPTACGVNGRCVLDGGHYLEGRFPGARRFIVRPVGGAAIRIGFLLREQRAPGTALEVSASEPGCADKTTWDSAGRDLFRLAASDGVILVDLKADRPGDHLIEIVSDAYCTYTLALDL